MFCHEAIRQLIRHGITRVHSDLFMRYLHYLSEENLNGKTRMQLQYEVSCSLCSIYSLSCFQDICECRHQPRCHLDSEVITLPGYHRSDEFMVATWQRECEELYRITWQRQVQTIVMLNQKDSGFWRRLQSFEDSEGATIQIQHGDNFILLQKDEKQLCVRIVNVSRADLEMDFWREIENVQKQRLTYHDAPLLILAHKFSPNGASPTDSTSTLSLSMLFNGKGPPGFWILQALNLLQTTPLWRSASVQPPLSRVNWKLRVVSTWYKFFPPTHIFNVAFFRQRWLRGEALLSNILIFQQEIEIIYEKISQLVGGTRVWLQISQVLEWKIDKII